MRITYNPTDETKQVKTAKRVKGSAWPQHVVEPQNIEGK
jgi:hypothetical protein